MRQHRKPADEVKHLEPWVKRGFTAAKIHPCEFLAFDQGTDDTLEVVQAVMSALGLKFRLFVDMNHANTVHRAIQIGRQEVDRKVLSQLGAWAKGNIWQCTPRSPWQRPNLQETWMREAGSGPVFSRRGLLTFVATAGGAAWNRALAAASEFWNRKPPAEWSSEEIDRLVTASPWARQVNAEVRVPERGESRSGGPNAPTDYPGGSRNPRGGGGMGGPSIGIPGVGLPRIGIGGMGGPRIGGGGMGGGRGGGRSAGRSQVKGTVRWESAKPILEALKSPLPEAFAGHYAISVSGFPLRGGRRSEVGPEGRGAETSEDALDRLKSFTYLEPTGKRTAQPGVVQHQPGVGDGTILFGFSKEFLNLAPGDKEVVFSTNLGRVTIKTKFDLKAMRYQGDLAV